METTGQSAQPGTLEYAAEQLLAPEENLDTGTADDGDQSDDLEEDQETDGAPSNEDSDDAEGDEHDDDADEDSEDESDDEDSEDTEEDDDDESEEDTDDDAETDPTFTVTVDGTEREVTLSELKRGYSGQASIHEGKREVAADRKEVQAVLAATQQDRHTLQVLIREISTNGLPRQPVEPTREQYPNDPLGLMEARDQYHRDVQTYQQQMGVLGQALQQESEATKAARDAQARIEAKQLMEAIPEFRQRDPKKAEKAMKEFKESVASAAASYGYSDEEIQGVVDHRNLLVLRDAARWRALQEKRNGARQDAENRPRRGKGKGKTLRPGAASKRKSAQRTKQRQQQRERLRESGSIDDAAALILQEPG